MMIDFLAEFMITLSSSPIELRENLRLITMVICAAGPETPFQVVIFVKSVQRCVALSQLLIEQNFPAIAIHRGMSQEERLSR